MLRFLLRGVRRVDALEVSLLVLIEPNILEAPFQNERTLLFTFGGTALAAIAYVVMLRFRVPPVRVTDYHIAGKPVTLPTIVKAIWLTTGINISSQKSLR